MVVTDVRILRRNNAEEASLIHIKVITHRTNAHIIIGQIKEGIARTTPAPVHVIHLFIFCLVAVDHPGMSSSIGTRTCGRRTTHDDHITIHQVTTDCIKETGIIDAITVTIGALLIFKFGFHNCIGLNHIGSTAIGMIIHMESHSKAIIQHSHLMNLLCRRSGKQPIGHQGIVELNSIQLDSQRLCRTFVCILPIIRHYSLGLYRILIVFAHLRQSSGHTASYRIAPVNHGAVEIVGRIVVITLIPLTRHQLNTLIFCAILEALAGERGVFLAVRIVSLGIHKLDISNHISITREPPAHVVGDITHVERAFRTIGDDGIHHRRAGDDNPSATIHVEEVSGGDIHVGILKLISQHELLGCNFVGATAHLVGHVIGTDSFRLVDGDIVGLGNAAEEGHRQH